MIVSTLSKKETMRKERYDSTVAAQNRVRKDLKMWDKKYSDQREYALSYLNSLKKQARELRQERDFIKKEVFLQTAGESAAWGLQQASERSEAAKEASKWAEKIWTPKMETPYNILRKVKSEALIGDKKLNPITQASKLPIKK